MSKVKYRVREYNPTSAQQGSHSFFAEAVINKHKDGNWYGYRGVARFTIEAQPREFYDFNF